MTQTVTGKWTDPAVPFTNVEVGMEVQGIATPTVVANVPAGVQTFSVPDLADGTYTFMLTVVTPSGRSAGISGTITLPFTAAGTGTTPPAVIPDVTGFTLTAA